MLLCELITRQPPFHDRYTIHSYMDIVEAVLDDGALPTIPAWSGSLLTPLIMRCLSRDPTARPSFHEIILRLRECEAMKEWEFFAIDLERLREQLEGANAAMQALGASELAVLLRERKVTRVKERACRVVKDRIERDGRSLTESGPGYRVDSISAELSPLPSPALAAAAAPGNRLSATFTLPLSPSVICTPLTSPRESSELQPSAWVLDNAMTQSFLERLTALLSSSFENVQYACCLALHSILSCSSPSSPTSASFHRHDRDLLVSEGAIRLLLSLLTSSNPLVVQHAGEVLLLLTASMSSAEMLQFVGSREAEMEVWTRIVEDDVRRCEREREEMDRALEAKRVHMGEVRLLCAQQRREKHEEAQREERGVSLSHTKPRMQRKRSKATRMSPDSTMSPSPSATPLATATPSISPYTSNPDASTLPPSLSFPVPLSADDRPMAPPAPARPSASSSPSPPLSPKRSHLKHFEYVLRHIESGAAHITLTSAGRRSRGNGKQEEQKEDDSACLSAEQRNTLLAQLSALSSSVACPASFSEYFSSILLSGPALRLERGGGEGWSVCYLVLTVGELRVYGSEKDEPDEARYVMRVKGGVGGNVTAAEVSGLHSLLVDDLGVHTFAFASEAVMKQWKQMMDSCGGDVEEERKEDRDTTDTAAELTAEEEAHCDELFSLLPIVEPSALLAFHAEYSSLSHSSYLVLMPSSSSAAPSAHFFLLSSGTHLYAFPSHTSSPTDSDYHFELDVAAMTAAMFHHVADEHQAMHSALFRLRTKGSMDELRLVAANSVERDRWAHAILPPEALPTAAATAAAAPNSSSSLPASEYSLAPFLSHFGPIDFAGFLHRRRRYSSRWLRQFAVLVGSDLYMYDSPLSSPGESTAACYVCTASGRPFEVVRGEGCVWEVTQPNGGSVVLKAENEKEYEVWRQAIEQSCKRLGDVAAARHRKYTH